MNKLSELPSELLKSEVLVFADEQGKHVNEYLVVKTIGKGAYSKVKLVTKGE